MQKQLDTRNIASMDGVLGTGVPVCKALGDGKHLLADPSWRRITEAVSAGGPSFATPWRVAAVMLWYRGYAVTPPPVERWSSAVYGMAAMVGRGGTGESDVDPPRDEMAVAAAAEGLSPHTSPAQLSDMVEKCVPQTFRTNTCAPPCTNPDAEEWRVVWEGRAVARTVDGTLVAAGLTGAVDRGDLAWIVSPAWFMPDDGSSGGGGSGRDRRLVKKHMVGLLTAARENGVRHVIILLPSIALFNHHCRNAVRVVQASGVKAHPDDPDDPFPVTVEAIATGELPNVTPAHTLVPRFAVVEPSEYDGVLTAMGQLDTTQPNMSTMPALPTTDIQALWRAWPPHTVVQYMRRLGHGTLAAVQTRCVIDESLASSRSSARQQKRQYVAWRILRPI